MQDIIDPKIKAFTLAIRDAESGGNYNAKGASGESGGYQFMPGRFSELAQKYLGDANAPMTPENQNKVVYSFVKEKKDAGFQPPQIASMWNAGEGRPNAYKENWRGVNEQGVAYDTPAYVEKVRASYAKNMATVPQPVQPVQHEAPQLSPSQQADIASAEQYKPTFAARTGEGPLAAGAKTAGNLLPSAFNFAKGVLDVLNPISTIKKLGEIKQGFGELTKESYGSPALAFSRVASEIPSTTVKTLVPESARALASAGVGLVKGDQQRVTEGLETAQRAITNDPFGQIAPWIGVARGVAGKTGAGAAFDATVSKVASPVTKTAANIAGGVKNRATGTVRFGASQVTGLQPETISQVTKTPEAFTPSSMSAVDRAAIGREVQSVLNKKISSLAETGKEYAPIRSSGIEVSIDSNWLTNKIKETTGMSVDKGKIKTSGAATLRDTSDVRAMQQLYNTWNPVFQKGKMTTNEFLNFRTDLANLSKFERQIGKSKPIENVTKTMRNGLNKEYRSKIKGLDKLDEQFSAQSNELKHLSKNIIDRNGNLTDASINRIANATGKGKDMLLSRLEEILPGVTQKIKILKAVEDIQHASGIKVGTYGRAALGVGVGLGAGVVPAIITAILTSPEVAVPLLRRYGLLKNSSAVRAVVGGLKNSGKFVNQLPENKTVFGTTKQQKNMSKTEINEEVKPTAFTPKTDLAEEAKSLTGSKGKYSVKETIIHLEKRGFSKDQIVQIMNNLSQIVKSNRVSDAEITQAIGDMKSVNKTAVKRPKNPVYFIKEKSSAI